MNSNIKSNLNKILHDMNETYVESEQDKKISIYVESMINEILHEVLVLNQSLAEKFNILSSRIENKIIDYLLKYRKVELISGLLSLKSYFRTIIGSSDIKIKDFEMSLRHEEILQLLNIIDRLEEKRFGNKSLSQERNYMSIVFRIAYYYNILMDNMEHFLENERKKDKVEIDLKTIFKEGKFYNNEYNKYMDDILKIRELEIAEDTEVQNHIIKKQMMKNNLSKEQIKRNVDVIIKEYFGFSLSDICNFACWGIRKEPNEFFVFMDKENYLSILKKEYNMQKNTFENILEIFSIARIPKSNLNSIRMLELRSVYEIDNKIMFAPFDFMYNIQCFEKFMLRKHFVEYFTQGWDKDKKCELEKNLSKHEEKMSTYLAYIILDNFYSGGYKLPIKDQCPIAEIRSIVINNNTNILKEKGDIDVLALDEEKKEIYNIEVKYYKPLNNLYEMDSNNKNDERDKNVLLPLKRAQILNNNIREVIEYLGGDISEISKYKVRTIFVTPRPDYWLKTNSRGIEYYEWTDCIKRIRNKKL